MITQLLVDGRGTLAVAGLPSGPGRSGAGRARSTRGRGGRGAVRLASRIADSMIDTERGDGLGGSGSRPPRSELGPQAADRRTGSRILELAETTVEPPLRRSYRPSWSRTLADLATQSRPPLASPWLRRRAWPYDGDRALVASAELQASPSRSATSAAPRRSRSSTRRAASSAARRTPPPPSGAVALGPLAGHARVVPRARRGARRGEVDGQQLGEGVGRPRPTARGSSPPGVQRPRARNDEAFVGDVTEEDVAEAQVPASATRKWSRRRTSPTHLGPGAARPSQPAPIGSGRRALPRDGAANDHGRAACRWSW